MSGIASSELFALCDPSEENLRKASEETGIRRLFTDWREAVNDPETNVVVVVTPTQLHHDIVVAAANAGKHVFCEKPMASTESECDDMISACEKNHVKLQIGFMRRFDKSFLRGKKLLDSGVIGKPALLKSNTYGPSQPKEWMYDVRKNYGPIGEVNSHDFDTLRWYAGSEVRMIHAIGGNFRSPEKAEKYPEYYDTCTIMLEFDNGILGMISGAQYVKYGYDSRAEILGTDGIIKIGSQRTNTVEVAHSNMEITYASMDSWRTLFKDAYLSEDIAFIDCIRKDMEPTVTGYDGKMGLILVNEGLRSLLEHRPVFLHHGIPEVQIS